MHIRLRASIFISLSVIGLSGCGTAPQAAPPKYKVWSVAADKWQKTSFVDTNGAVVIAMASWCKYCAWEAKWQEPQLFHWGQAHHIRIALVDISPRGGIGVAGPANNAAAGHDGTGPFYGASRSGIKALDHTLQEYAAIYHLPLTAFTIDPTDATPFAKKAEMIPAIFLLNQHGQITRSFQGTTPASTIEAAFGTP
ncbi:MAG: hypothetical protein OWR62_09610 [Sulfobacillus thermotolerans]|nr:hypothetical protein [Sulfobacillus thermotolerans]